MSILVFDRTKPQFLAFNRDVNGFVSYGLNPTTVRSLLLTADTEALITVPTNSTLAIFSFSLGIDVWVTQGTTPITVPTTDAPVSDLMWLNPVARVVDGLDPTQVIRVISASPAFVNVEFYKTESV